MLEYPRMGNEFPIIITLSIIISLLLVFLLALTFSRKVPSVQKDGILKQIDEIKYSMTLHNPSSNRDGIVRLDALLSKTLQLRHGNLLTCGENLKKSRAFMGKKLYEDIWYYHKLRNRIVHDNIEIEDEDAYGAYKTYHLVITKLLN